MCRRNGLPLFKDHKHSYYDQAETKDMVPLKALLKNHHREDHKDGQCNSLLYGFELHQAKRTTIILKPDAVGWNLEQVLKEGKPPANEYNREEPQVLAPAHILEFEVAIPGNSHKGVGDNKEGDGKKCFHE